MANFSNSQIKGWSKSNAATDTSNPNSLNVLASSNVVISDPVYFFIKELRINTFFI